MSHFAVVQSLLFLPVSAVEQQTKKQACASLSVSSRTVLRVTVCANCIVVRVSRTDGSQSTWLLKRTISVKVKEKKNVQLEFEKEVPLNLGLSASGVDTGLRLPGEGSDQEGRELRWNYVRLKSATPPQGGISAGHNNRSGGCQIRRKPQDHSEKTQSLLNFPLPVFQMRSLENVPLKGQQRFKGRPFWQQHCEEERGSKHRHHIDSQTKPPYERKGNGNLQR